MVLVTVYGTIKIRLWFLKFIFIQLRTHTLLCICCVYNIVYHVSYIINYKHIDINVSWNTLSICDVS